MSSSSVYTVQLTAAEFALLAETQYLFQLQNSKMVSATSLIKGILRSNASGWTPQVMDEAIMRTEAVAGLRGDFSKREVSTTVSFRLDGASLKQFYDIREWLSENTEGETSVRSAVLFLLAGYTTLLESKGSGYGG